MLSLYEEGEGCALNNISRIQRFLFNREIGMSLYLRQRKKNWFLFLKYFNESNTESISLFTNVIYTHNFFCEILLGHPSLIKHREISSHRGSHTITPWLQHNRPAAVFLCEMGNKSLSSPCILCIDGSFLFNLQSAQEKNLEPARFVKATLVFTLFLVR